MVDDAAVAREREGEGRRDGVRHQLTSNADMRTARPESDRGGGEGVGGARPARMKKRRHGRLEAPRLDSVVEVVEGDTAVLVCGFNSDGEVPGDGGELGIVAAVEKLGLGFRLGFPKGRVRGGEREAGHGALCIHLRQGGAWRRGVRERGIGGMAHRASPVATVKGKGERISR